MTLTPLQTALTALAKSLHVELVEPVRAGHAVVARVNHLPSEVDLIEMRQIDINLSGTLNAITVTRTENPTTRITKNVQFTNFTPEPGDLAEPAIGAATPVSVPGLEDLAGTSGILQQLATLVTGTTVSPLLGTLTGKVGVPVPTRRQVAVQVGWKIVEKVSATKENVLQEGTDFVAPGGVAGPTLSAVIIPRILTQEPAQDSDTLTRFLRATLTLTAAGESITHTLTDLEIRVPPLVLLLGKLLVPTLVGRGSEPGMPNTAVLEPPLSELKSVTGAFDLVYDPDAAGRTGLTLPLQVEWRLTEDEGGTKPLAQGTVPHDADGLAAPAVSVVLGPKVVRFLSGFPRLGGASLDVVYLHVSVRLAGKGPDGAAYPAVPLARIPLPVPTLQVPTMLALFNHSDFSLGTHGGIPPCAALLYPTESPIGAGTPAAVIDVIRTFHAAVSRLAGSFPSVPGVGLLSHAVGPLGRLVELATALHAATTPDEEKGWKLVVRPTNREDDLERIVFYRETFTKQSAEDSLGSMLFIGSPGDGARFCIAEEMSVKEGAFTLRLPTGDKATCAAVVHTLHAGRPRSTPETAVNDIVAPEDGSFGDRLSSFEFL